MGIPATMDPSHPLLIACFFLVAAILYSSVGHAGASGYLAVMAFCNFSPQVMKPTALFLNILVASIGTIQFLRARCFSFSLFWPFAITATPAAFLGSSFHVEPHLYRPLLSFVLFCAAIRMLLLAYAPRTTAPARSVPLWQAALAGTAIGLLSGITGTGGGIFLSPLLLWTGWADSRTTAGISVAFILLNSIAGLAGASSTLQYLPHATPIWATTVLLGGLIGSTLGSTFLGRNSLNRILALVLILAAWKFAFT